MTGRDSSSRCKLRTLMLVFLLTIGVLMIIPNAVHAEPIDILRDTVGPKTCLRYFENSTLFIGVEILNTWSTSIEIKGNLTFPTSFLEKLKDHSNETKTQYYTTGIKGVIGNCTYIPGNQSRVSIFSFPTQGSFVESEYYNLEIQWRLIPTIEETLPTTHKYTQKFNVTPFDWVNQKTMQPMEIEDEKGEKDYDLYDLRITTVGLPDSSIYKGDSVEVRVTVHNYGVYGMKAFLNAEIKEDSGLYIGFDKGVWSYYGNGVDMIYYVRPGITYTYYFAFGPVLYDDYRGIWALNGRIDADSYVAASLWYELYQVKLRGYSGGFRTTDQYFCSRSFSVIQKSSAPRILAAVVDDETCWVDPAAFFEGVVDYSIRIGEGENLGSYTTFEQEFNVDFRFYEVGSYNWHDSTHGQASKAEAIRNTRYALGQGLKLGGNWIDESVSNPDNPDYSYGYTQRENHGFDIGVGFLPAGFSYHDGEGRSRPLGSSGVVIGAYLPNYNKVKESALHELCHLFGALHGDQYNPAFGPQQGGDGYTYVMAGGTGADLFPSGWRMHTLTKQKINENNHLRKFDGAPSPELISGKWYGQTECYVRMNGNHYGESVYTLDSDGLYHWGYNSQDYTRFSITDSFTLGIEQVGRVLSSKYIDAEVSYPNPGTGNFYAAYNLYWSSDYWPTGYNPSQGIDLDIDFWSWQNSDTTISHVDNVRIQIISSRYSSPAILYSTYFEAASPSSGWEYCHNQWALQKVLRGIDLTDSTVYLLLGMRDAWSADWNQQVKVYPTMIHFYYTWNVW